MMKFTLFTALSLFANLGIAAEKSALLHPAGSGHYAQILLGSNQNIVPIRFKTDQVGIAQNSTCGDGIAVNTMSTAGTPYHVSGKPNVDSCSIRFTVGTEEITVELFRLPEPPPEDQWAGILNNLKTSVKLPPYSAVYISSTLDPVPETKYDVFGAMLNVDAERKQGTGEPKLEDLPMSEVEVTLVRPADRNKYSSCRFVHEQRATDPNPMLYVKFVPNKVGILPTDSAIESCELTFKGQSPSIDPQPEPASLVNFFVVKSYL